MITNSTNIRAMIFSQAASCFELSVVTCMEESSKNVHVMTATNTPVP